MKNIDNPISIIDVSSLQNKAPSPELLRSFYNAYHNQGFGYIINHGIDQKLIEKVFEHSRCFHNLSLNMFKFLRTYKILNKLNIILVVIDSKR